MDIIIKHLPEGDKLVEPFVGAGTVFLNTNYKEYLLNDINADLINLFNIVKKNPPGMIAEMRALFDAKYNTKEAFYQLREEFNSCTDVYRRSVIFLYLNRHCYNGLCRYNQGGGFNVPFGAYSKPYFPELELEFFTEKAQKATFTCGPYSRTFGASRKGAVIYCDPPYVPLSKTASFTTYSKDGFGDVDQRNLAKLAEKAAYKRNIPVLISNHDTPLTRKIYQNSSHLDYIQVARTISHKGDERSPVAEIFALYHNVHGLKPAVSQQASEYALEETES